jgi:hypothetical protein
MMWCIEYVDENRNPANKYLGFRAGCNLAHGVEFEKSYKFYNKSSAEAFLRLLRDDIAGRLNPYKHFIVTEHEEI